MSDNPNHIHVLYVDDEENNLVAFKASFRRMFTVFTAISVDEGLKILKENDIHVLITDQRMPDKLGTDLLAEAAEAFPDQTRVMLTGFSDIEAIKDAVNRGKIYHYMQKPWSDEKLRKLIQEAYEVYDLKQQQKDLNDKLRTVNGQLEFMLRQKLIS